MGNTERCAFLLSHENNYLAQLEYTNVNTGTLSNED
jgi:hypothetical protein